jgi:hypothetical protein
MAWPQMVIPSRVMLMSPRDPPFQNREFIQNNQRPWVDLLGQTDEEDILRPLTDRDTHGEHLYRFRDWDLQPNVHWLRPDYRPWFFTINTRSTVKDISEWLYNEGPNNSGNPSH